MPLTSLLPVTPLLVEEASTFEEVRALTPEWEALASQMQPALPFHHPWWQMRWFEVFAQDRMAIRDSLRVYSLRRTSGALVAVAPMMITERPSRGPLRVRVLQFLGADPNITELRGVLCAPSDERDVYRTLLGELRRTSESWDQVRWNGLRQGGEGEALVLAESGTEAGVTTPDYLLDLPGSWEEFRAGLSRNIKESLRKCANAPKRDQLAFELRVVTEPQEVIGSLDHFFALHAARSEATMSVHHNDAFHGADARQFFRAVALAQCAAGAFRVYEVRCAGKVIASRVAFVLGEAMYLYYSGYDPAYAKYSVMTTCTAFALRHAIEGGLQTVNLSSGNDVSKTRWSPREVLFREAVWTSPTPRGQLARRANSLFEMARGNNSLRGSALGRLFSLGARRNE